MTLDLPLLVWSAIFYFLFVSNDWFFSVFSPFLESSFLLYFYSSIFYVYFSDLLGFCPPYHSLIITITSQAPTMLNLRPSILLQDYWYSEGLRFSGHGVSLRSTYTVIGYVVSGVCSKELEDSDLILSNPILGGIGYGFLVLCCFFFYTT